MWRGRTSVDSHGAGASPAMTVIPYGIQNDPETLLLAWPAGDGTIYTATGMEKNGVISASPLPLDASGNKISTLQRFGLVQIPSGPLALSWTDTNDPPQVWLGYSYQPGQPLVEYPETWSYVDGTLIPPDIGGPAILPVGNGLYIAGTAVVTQQLYAGSGPPEGYTGAVVAEYVQTGYQSIDTPALGTTPADTLQLAYAGVDPDNFLTISPIGFVVGVREVGTPVVYPDHCYGGPALVTTVNGYAAAFVNVLKNIVLLYGVENLDPAMINRVVLQDTSWHAPAVATINDVTYVAWIGTDDPTGLQRAVARQAVRRSV